MDIKEKAMKFIQSLTESQFKEYFDESRVYLVKNGESVDSYGSKASLILSTGSDKCDLDIPAGSWKGVAIVSKSGSILLQDTLENTKNGKIRDLTIAMDREHRCMISKYSEAELASFGYQYSATAGKPDLLSSEALIVQITARTKYSPKTLSTEYVSDKIVTKARKYLTNLAVIVGTYQGLVDKVEYSKSVAEVEAIVWPDQLIGVDN